MALLTLVARASDGLPLSASTVDSDESGRTFADHQARAKQIFKKLTKQSPTRCSIDCDGLVFHYIIEGGVCFLALCEMGYPPRLAYSYLDNLQKEFNDQYGQEVFKAKRPYHFIEFGADINKIKKNYLESQGRRTTQLRGLGEELQGVQKIMYDNIDAVLQRGELLSELSDKAGRLSHESKIYKKEAGILNLRASWAVRIAVLIVIFLFFLFLRYMIF